MKKFISLLVTLTMLIGCFSLTACDITGLTGGEDDNTEDVIVDIEEVKNNPLSAIQSSTQNTSSSFFDGDKALQNNMSSALEKGSIRFYFASDYLMDDLTEIDEIIYIDKVNNKYVSDTSITYSGESYFARLFVDSNRIAVNSNDLFGTSDTYFIDFTTILENIVDSDLLLALKASESDFNEEEFMMGLKMLVDYYKSVFAEQTSEEVDLSGIYEALNVKVENESLNGKPVVSISFSFDNETIITLFEGALDKIDFEDISGEELDKATVVKQFSDMLEAISIDASGKLYINATDNTFVKQTLKIDVEEKPSASVGSGSYGDSEEAMPMSFTISSEVSYSSDEIVAEIGLSAYGMEIAGAKLELTKEDTASELAYNMDVSVTMEAVTVNLVDASFVLDKQSGDFEGCAKVFTEDGQVKAGFTGNITNTETKSTISFDSVYFEDEIITFDARIELEKLAEIPEIPADAKDVVLLDISELNALVEYIENSRIGNLFGTIE